MNVFEKLKSNITISDVLQKYAPRKITRNGMCVCPLHRDKDASMKISDEKGAFYCFGCGGKGDIVDLCAKTNNITNQQAIMLLGKDFGVEVNSDKVDYAELRQRRIEKEAAEVEERRKQEALNIINNKIIKRLRELRAYNQWQFDNGVPNKNTFETNRAKIFQLEDYYTILNEIDIPNMKYEANNLLNKIRNKQIII